MKRFFLHADAKRLLFLVASLAAIVVLVRGGAQPALPDEAEQPEQTEQVEQTEQREPTEEEQALLTWAHSLITSTYMYLQTGTSSGQVTGKTAQFVACLNALTVDELFPAEETGGYHFTLDAWDDEGVRHRFRFDYDGVCLCSRDDASTVLIKNGALGELLLSLVPPADELPSFETAEPTALILPARTPWLTIPFDDVARPLRDLRIPQNQSGWLRQVDLDGDGVCEIVDTSENAALYDLRDGEVYRIDLKEAIGAAWPELDYWDYLSVVREGRFLSLSSMVEWRTTSEHGIEYLDAFRTIYYDGEQLLLYRPDRSAVDHVAVTSLALGLPDEVLAQARADGELWFEELCADGALYDDWVVTIQEAKGDPDVPYYYDYAFHAVDPDAVVVAGGMWMDEDFWVGGMGSYG